jgi:hypothetical protein
MTNTLHVTPMHDLVDHDTSTAEADCACGPEVRPAARMPAALPRGAGQWAVASAGRVMRSVVVMVIASPSREL